MKLFGEPVTVVDILAVTAYAIIVLAGIYFLADGAGDASWYR